AGRRDRPRRRGPRRAGPRLPRHPHAGPHGRPLCAALPRTIPVHRRPPRLGPPPPPADGAPRLLLALVAAAAGVHRAAGWLCCLRVGVARPRAARPSAGRADAAADGGSGRADARGSLLTIVRGRRKILRTGLGASYGG